MIHICPQQQGASLHEEREEMEDKIQKILKLTRDREASYERQIASLKEEAMATQRRFQGLSGHRAEVELLEEDQPSDPSHVISR